MTESSLHTTIEHASQKGHRTVKLATHHIWNETTSLLVRQTRTQQQKHPLGHQTTFGLEKAHAMTNQQSL